MDSNVQISQISEEQLDALFKDTPDTTPSADTLKLGKETEGTLDIPQIDDLDEFEKQVEIDTAAEQAKADKKAKKKEKEVKTEDNEETEEEEEEVKDAKEPEEKEEVKETSVEIKEALKNTVDHFIQSGLWKDFEGRDTMEFDTETYAALAKAQEEAKLDEKFNELVDSTGTYGQAIIEHIKNGGNPEDVIDIFKEQKQIEAIDASTDEGKIELIGRYYSEIVGWKPEKVQKHIKRLIDAGDEDFDSEVSDVKEKYDEHYNAQLESIKQQTEQAKQVEKQRQEAFKTKIKSVLQEEPDLSEKEKRQLERAILEFKNKLPNGAAVNDFYVKFAEMQKDPKEYIKLVQFVTDRQNYEKKLKLKADTTAAKSSFQFIKGNSATSKNKGSKHSEAEQEGSNTLDFKSLLKK